MILKVEGSLSEVTEFLDRINRPRIIPFPVLVKAGCAHSKEKAGQATSAPSKKKTPAEKPKADTSAPDIEKVEKKPKKEKPGQATNAPAKKKKTPGRKIREITIEEIKQEVPLEECDGIPEAIEAILEICKTSGSSLARALDLAPSDISVAKKGTVYPYIMRAFKQHLQFPAVADPSASEL